MKAETLPLLLAPGTTFHAKGKTEGIMEGALPGPAGLCSPEASWPDPLQPTQASSWPTCEHVVRATRVCVLPQPTSDPVVSGRVCLTRLQSWLLLFLFSSAVRFGYISLIEEPVPLIQVCL